MIRKMNINDLGKVAEVHLNSYTKDHFTAHLSKKLLMKYYGELLKLTRYAYISEDLGSLNGFLLGGDNLAAGIRSFTRKNIISLATISLFNMRLLFNKIARVFARRKNNGKRMVLLSICVNKSAQGSGIGKKLTEEFEKDLVNDGIGQYVLSVKPDNLKAVKFYEHCGYKKVEEGRYSIVYEKKLS